MDKTVPAPAAKLLEFIGSVEAPGGYDVIFGNRQNRLSKPLTQMTLGEVLAQGPVWANWTPKPASSACGRYQFMAGRKHTLQGLKDELKLRDTQIFDANLQDRLGYHLLRRRGYDGWMAGRISDDEFMLNLSKEWASFPVPMTVQGQKRSVTRGQSYYVGDGVNKALVSPERVEAKLAEAKREGESVQPQILPQVLNNPQILDMLQTALQRATQQVGDNPYMPSVQPHSAPIVAEQIFGQLVQDPGFQHTTSTEKWWQKRSRWSMIFAIATPAIAMATGLAVPYEVQEFAITGIIGAGNLIAGWLAYRAGTASRPLFSGS